ncbi:MAG TPA: hypothetical protein VHC90_15010 [Bryobacteraceae bacterium]|nr:hypothetical protein [Bryobacteraceae bacterium]
MKTVVHPEKKKDFTHRLAFVNLEDLLRSYDVTIWPDARENRAPALRIKTSAKLELDFKLDAHVTLLPRKDGKPGGKLVFQNLRQNLRKRGLQIESAASGEAGKDSALAIRLLKFDLPGPQTLAPVLLKAAATNSATGESSRSSFGPGGESPQHKALKEYVATHPLSIGLPAEDYQPTFEEELPSGDRLDVSFMGADWVAVEVKSRISTTADITRGMFQCVKYVAVMNAVQVCRGERQNARAILALQGTIPPELRSLRDQLRVDVRENVIPQEAP